MFRGCRKLLPVNRKMVAPSTSRSGVATAVSLGGEESLPLCETCVGGENNGSLSVPGGDDAEQIVGCL